MHTSNSADAGMNVTDNQIKKIMKLHNLIKGNKTLNSLSFFIVFSFSFISSDISDNQMNPDDKVMQISFGSYFYNDTVSMDINGVNIFSNKILNKKSIGREDVMFNINESENKGYWSIKSEDSLVNVLAPESIPLQVRVEVNRRFFQYCIFPAQGKYLCFHRYREGLSFDQKDSKFLFED